MFKSFYRYRNQAFKYEVRLLSEQLKQILGLVFLVFASAVPGILLLIFMGLGKVITAQGGSSIQAGAAWCFLAGQTVLLYALRHAILNNQQRMFQFSLAQKPWWIWICDGRNLLLSHVFMWCSLFLLFTMNTAQLIQNSAFIVFILLQISLAGLSIYRMQQSVVFCLLTALTSIYWLDQSMLSIMLAWGVLLLFCALMPSYSVNVAISVTGQMRFWLSFYLNHYKVLVWRIACSVLIMSVMGILASERDDMSYLASYLSGFFSLLIWLTLHIEVKKITDEYSLFFCSIDQTTPFFRFRLLNTLILITLMTLIQINLFEQAKLAVSFWCMSLVCLYLAEKKPELCALVWGICLVGGLFI